TAVSPNGRAQKLECAAFRAEALIFRCIALALIPPCASSDVTSLLEAVIPSGRKEVVPCQKTSRRPLPRRRCSLANRSGIVAMQYQAALVRERPFFTSDDASCDEFALTSE